MSPSEFIQLFNDVQRASGLFGGEISFPLLPVLSINQLASSDPPLREPRLLPRRVALRHIAHGTFRESVLPPTPKREDGNPNRAELGGSTARY